MLLKCLNIAFDTSIIRMADFEFDSNLNTRILILNFKSKSMYVHHLNLIWANPPPSISQIILCDCNK